jgi:hypothetical protein
MRQRAADIAAPDQGNLVPCHSYIPFPIKALSTAEFHRLFYPW